MSNNIMMGDLVVIMANSEQYNAVAYYTKKYGNTFGIVIDSAEYSNHDNHSLLYCVNFNNDMCWIDSKYLCKYDHVVV